MSKIGYARVSTAEQSLNVQIDTLKTTDCERIFEEKVLGKKNDRVEFSLFRIFENQRHSCDLEIGSFRMTTRQLIELSHQLQGRVIGLQSSLSMSVQVLRPGNFFFAIMARLAEMEAETIRERTKAGLQAARARGRKGGRPPMNKNKIDMALTLYKIAKNIRLRKSQSEQVCLKRKFIRH